MLRFLSWCLNLGSFLILDPAVFVFEVARIAACQVRWSVEAPRATVVLGFSILAALSAWFVAHYAAVPFIVCFRSRMRRPALSHCQGSHTVWQAAHSRRAGVVSSLGM